MKFSFVNEHVSCIVESCRASRRAAHKRLALDVNIEPMSSQLVAVVEGLVTLTTLEWPVGLFPVHLLVMLLVGVHVAQNLRAF